MDGDGSLSFGKEGKEGIDASEGWELKSSGTDGKDPQGDPGALEGPAFDGPALFPPGAGFTLTLASEVEAPEPEGKTMFPR